MKAIKDLWDKNLAATSNIANRIDGVFRELEVAEQRADEVDKHLKLLKCDLKNWHNSAFYKEDSLLIRQKKKNKNNKPHRSIFTRVISVKRK